MDPITVSIIAAATQVVLTEFIKYQQIKARDPGWKPSIKDVDEFVASIRADTPEKIKSEIGR